MEELIKDTEVVENLDFNNDIGLDIQDAVIEESLCQEMNDDEVQKGCFIQTIEPELEEFILGCEEGDVYNVNSKEMDNKMTKSYQELESYFNNIKCKRVVGVYAKVNKEGYITELLSDIFTNKLEGSVKIDEGEGDRFVYPEGNYFNESLVDDNGNYRYKLTNN